MIRKAYDTDLTDQEWAKLEPYFSKNRTYKWSKRELVNATLYITKTGCQWRMLPHDFPPYPTLSGVSFVVPRRAACGTPF
ncbi:TPA: transposase [Streptococcus equi subsp. zooepidemicus]|nr:transposase [Streptococcus equi subsp. zooepidemicus]HEL0817337.1 transposase [Streptococcus equi subsp. zooepidemicus]